MLEQLGQEDLQIKNKWYCNFRDLGKSDFMIKSINLPFDKLITETKKYGEKKYVGFTPVEDITITFYENTAFEIYKFFKDWMDQIFDSKTKTFKVLADESVKYKTASVTMYRHQGLPTLGKSTTSAQILLERLMILGIDELSLDQETGSPLEWSVQLKVKNVIMQ